jgi:hypothetical protein
MKDPTKQHPTTVFTLATTRSHPHHPYMKHHRTTTHDRRHP